ncbi:hypothetical protein J2X47_000120 [Sphingomonas sp. BE270]|jgi:hypothetical protein|uniref:hypothetical protein n=1 Tax=unclassified Sphingomonas TaxID=196159 RepID=UPI00053D3F3E|nr:MULTISPECIES: hypothetical protein [unclassified Sphingomonas]MDR6848677.1 hypothetical protein [Sphingomonas sp. BE137]MDR7255959.1 hypothetical protein [Sphingomonas sp. BE270]
MRKSVIAVAALLPLLGGGCLAKTVVNVATLPVRATSKAVDWTTTSQSEADRNYGRKMRKQEAREGRDLKRQYKECRAQNRDDCDQYRPHAER